MEELLLYHKLQVASIHQGMQLVLTGTGTMVISSNSSEQKWLEILTTLEFATKWNLKVQVTGSTLAIIEAITNKQALVVSDGSFKQGSRACAWIIKGSTSKYRIIGSMITPGFPGDQSSFQSKEASQYGLLITLWHILETKLQLQGSLTVACDGMSVLD